MFLVDLLIGLGILLVFFFALTLVLTLGFSMPLADAFNRILRRVGLAGAYEGSRTIGGHGVGVVDEPFTVAHDGARAEGTLLARGELWKAKCDPALASGLEPGDEVEFVYDADLTVTVVRKSAGGPGAT